MFYVTRENVTPMNPGTVQSEGVHFVTEASTIGLPAGSWPCHLDTNLGNGAQLAIVTMRSGTRIYRQLNGSGVFLHVLND